MDKTRSKAERRAEADPEDMESWREQALALHRDGALTPKFWLDEIVNGSVPDWEANDWIWSNFNTLITQLIRNSEKPMLARAAFEVLGSRPIEQVIKNRLVDWVDMEDWLEFGNIRPARLFTEGEAQACAWHCEKLRAIVGIKELLVRVMRQLTVDDGLCEVFLREQFIKRDRTKPGRAAALKPRRFDIFKKEVVARWDTGDGNEPIELVASIDIDVRDARQDGTPYLVFHTTGRPSNSKITTAIQVSGHWENRLRANKTIGRVMRACSDDALHLKVSVKKRLERMEKLKEVIGDDPDFEQQPALLHRDASTAIMNDGDHTIIHLGDNGYEMDLKWLNEEQVKAILKILSGE